MTPLDIAISSVQLGPEVEQSVLGTLRSGIIAQGPRVAELETAFCELAGTDHAVAVNNGTTALVLALGAAGIGPGDEVVTSPFTFAATLNAILDVGATACFADIDDTFAIDPDGLVAALTERTRALLPVHLYGQPADMAAMVATTAERDLILIEDAAQAHGATFDGRPVGSFGIGCFSLYATKNVTSGEGGVVTTADAGLAEQMRILRNQGMRGRYEYVVPGHNYRMTDLQAAVALPQLAVLAEVTARRVANATRLTRGLDDVPGLRLPRVAARRTHVWHQYTVLVEPDAPVTRDELAAGLAARGIGSGVYYPRLVFDYECYRNHPRVRPSDVPRAQRAAERVLSLPVHPHLSNTDVDRIIHAVREVARA